jgi:hypothetical protein
MKKLLLASGVGLAVMALGTSAFAWDWPYVEGTVTRVQVGSAGNFNFQLTGTPNLCTTATDRTWGMVSVGSAGVTAEGQRAMLATITAAYLSGKKVKVYANSGTPLCAVGVVELIP